jgi:hypothetical protein
MLSRSRKLVKKPPCGNVEARRAHSEAANRRGPYFAGAFVFACIPAAPFVDALAGALVLAVVSEVVDDVSSGLHPAVKPNSPAAAKSGNKYFIFIGERSYKR